MGKQMRYTPEMRTFIAENVKGRHYAELADMFNERFGTEVTASQMDAYAGNHRMRNGLDCRLKPGNVPYNKGQKGIHAPGCEKGWFKKGGVPHNHLPVGSEVIRTDGYLQVKIAEPNKWKLKHLLVWEEANGPKPKGAILLFKDGNRLNVTLENLALITRSELATLNRWDLLKKDAELTEVAINIAKLKHATAQAKKSRKRGKSND